MIKLVTYFCQPGLGCSDKAVEKDRKQGDKEGFAEWSRDRDPDNLAWTWEGSVYEVYTKCICSTNGDV